MGDEHLEKGFIICAHNFWELKDILSGKYPALKGIELINRKCINTHVNNGVILNFYYKYHGKAILNKKYIECSSRISKNCMKKIYKNICYYKGNVVCPACFDELKRRDTLGRRGRRPGTPNKKDSIVEISEIIK